MHRSQRRVFPVPMIADLTQLLRRRVAVIADHEWRDRDPVAHLDALRGVSEQISTWTAAHRTSVDPQLRHFLANSSFQKALAYLEASNEESPGN